QLTNKPDPIEPDPAWPELPAVEAVIHKAMSIRPADRHGSPAALFADLRLALYPGETVQDRRVTARLDRATVVAPAIQPPRPRWWLTVAFGLPLALGLGVLMWLFTSRGGTGATAPGVTPGEVVFGLTGPFSGPTREMGRGIKAGIETRFRVANARGGVHGRK